MVHVPLYVSDDFRGKSGAGLFGDVVMEVDWSVGEVLDAIEDIGAEREHAGHLYQRQRTLVVLRDTRGPGDAPARGQGNDV